MHSTFISLKFDFLKLEAFSIYEDPCTIQQGANIGNKMDTNKVDGTKKQTSTKVDVDSVLSFCIGNFKRL